MVKKKREGEGLTLPAEACLTHDNRNLRCCSASRAGIFGCFEGEVRFCGRVSGGAYNESKKSNDKSNSRFRLEVVASSQWLCEVPCEVMW